MSACAPGRAAPPPGKALFDVARAVERAPASVHRDVLSRDRAVREIRALGSSRALLMRGHGCVVVGDSIQSMVMAAINLRDNAQVQLWAMQLGQPKFLSYEEGRQARKIAQESAVALGRAWEYWVARAKKAMPDIA